ncbi:MAG: hypothetical protein AAGD92_06975 [Pseudomonadota bacterium]
MKPKPLYVLAIVFVISFLGRIIVFAEDLNAISGEQVKTAETTLLNVDSVDPGKSCITGELAQSVAKRIDQLDRQSEAISNREIELRTYEKQIEKRINQLEAVNSAFEAKVDKVQAAQKSDIARLALIYEGMKPAQASQIIEKMDPKFAAGILASISSEQAAQIIAAMDTEKAYLVSVLIANNNIN